MNKISKEYKVTITKVYVTEAESEDQAIQVALECFYDDPDFTSIGAEEQADA